jgi:hypothetical protein
MPVADIKENMISIEIMLALSIFGSTIIPNPMRLLNKYEGLYSPEHPLSSRCNPRALFKILSISSWIVADVQVLF